MRAVAEFDDFTPDNDPYGEHDFGAVEVGGQKIFFKIDTFADESLTDGADDPLSDRAVRVMTVMLAEETSSRLSAGFTHGSATRTEILVFRQLGRVAP